MNWAIDPSVDDVACCHSSETATDGTWFWARSAGKPNFHCRVVHGWALHLQSAFFEPYANWTNARHLFCWLRPRLQGHSHIPLSEAVKLSIARTPNICFSWLGFVVLALEGGSFTMMFGEALMPVYRWGQCCYVDRNRPFIAYQLHSCIFYNLITTSTRPRWFRRRTLSGGTLWTSPIHPHDFARNYCTNCLSVKSVSELITKWLLLNACC